MRKHHMISNHAPERGEYGDCLRTCIACLLDADDVRDVPHFAEYWADHSPDEMWQGVREWLMDEHNMSLWFIPYATDDWRDVTKSCDALNPGMFYMLMGGAPAGDHIVICQGDRIIHDPSRMGGGLIGPGSNGVFMVVLIVPDRLVM